jgi:hypothetical protein
MGLQKNFDSTEISTQQILTYDYKIQTCVRSVYSIQHYMLKFVSDLWQVCGFLCVLYTTLYVKVCQWLVAGLWFSLCTLYNIIWSSLSVTCGRSVVFSCVLYATLYDQVCQWLVAGLWFSLCTLYNIIWSSLSVTCGRSVVFSVYSIQHYMNKFLSDLWQVVVFSVYSMLYYVIKFVSDLWQVCGFLCVLYTTLYDQVC